MRITSACPHPFISHHSVYQLAMTSHILVDLYVCGWVVVCGGRSFSTYISLYISVPLSKQTFL